MKKIFSILMMVVLICGLALPLMSCSNKVKYEYAFITDLHVVANSSITQENYQSYSKRQKLLHISEAILQSLVDELIQKKYKYVFVGGDITEYGDEASHLVAAEAFDRLQKSGCKVFVINGNHDLPVNKGEIGKKINPTRFKEIYKEFGYDNAIEQSPNTLSYVANINKKYRVIGVDNMVHYGQEEIDEKSAAMSNIHIGWVEEQVDKCIQDKVTPIVFGHDTMLDHYHSPFIQAALNRVAGKQFTKLTKSLADKGAKFVFAGHDHVQDINFLTTENDNQLYEVAGASMTLYPLTYREMSFTTKKVVINSCSFDSLNSKYLPSASPVSLKKELESGLQTYCYNHFYNYISNLIVTAPYMLKGMGLPEQAQQIADIFADDVIAKIAINPFYIADEDNNMSLQRILNKYDIDLPQSNYTNLADLVPHMVMKLLSGDGNFVGGPELDLVKYTVLSVFYYLEQQSQNLSTLMPDHVLNIDLDKLFRQERLEAYDSNLMPFAIAFVKGINKTVGNALGNFDQNFNKIKDDVIKAVIAGFTNGIITDLDQYFTDKDILLGKLFDDGLWGDYGATISPDKQISDTYLEINLQ